MTTVNQIMKRFGGEILKGSCGLTRKLSSSSILQNSRIVESEVMDLQLPNLSFHEMCWSREGKWGERAALVDAVRGDKYTMSEAHALSRSFGHGLVNLGAQRGDVVAVILPNMPEYTFVMFGASEAALRVTTLNPTYTPKEINGQLVNSESNFLVTTSALLEKAKAASEGLEMKIIVIGDSVDPDCFDYKQITNNNGSLLDSIAPPDINSVYALPYSSGTTGVPKGVMLTHGNLTSQMAQMAHPRFKVIDENEVNICVLPMYHIFAMNVTMSGMMYQGGLTITVPMFEPGMFLKTMLEYRPTNLQLAPPLVGFLASHPAVTQEHLASLKTVVVGAAPAGPALIDLFLKKAPHVRLREGYGMTEMSPAVTFTDLNTNQTGGSCGQLLPNTRMKVLDLVTGEERGAGEDGELCFEGPQVMPGYFKNEKATSETLIDGWIHTGDIGHYDENGSVYIVDRKKELIKVKGLQVAPAELENSIRGIPGVMDVAVIGIPNERAGEVPRAYIVKSIDDLKEETIINTIAEQLSKHKHLAGGVEFVDAIPKSAAGKILRKDLKAAYQNTL